MFKFIARRLAQSVLVILIIITVTFFMVRLAPGDPFSAERKMPEHIKQRLEIFPSVIILILLSLRSSAIFKARLKIANDLSRLPFNK